MYISCGTSFLLLVSHKVHIVPSARKLLLVLIPMHLNTSAAAKRKVGCGVINYTHVCKCDMH